MNNDRKREDKKKKWQNGNKSCIQTFSEVKGRPILLCWCHERTALIPGEDTPISQHYLKGLQCLW